MSSYITVVSETIGTGILFIACIVCVAVPAMSNEHGMPRMNFAGLAAISKAAMNFGDCNMSLSIPCYSAALMCGINACYLGPYSLIKFKENMKASWVYCLPTSTTSAEDLEWGFYSASISSCNVSYAVTIDAAKRNNIDATVFGIKWNGNQN